MNTTSVAVVILLFVAVGIYVGATNLISMYGIEPSGGSAEGVACAPEVAEYPASKPAKFTASGLTDIYHWASDEGRSEVTVDGGFEVRYSKAGQKTVYLFHVANDRWYRTACSVLIK